MSLLQMKSKIVIDLHILNRRMVSDGSKINSYVMHVCFRFYEKMFQRLSSLVIVIVSFKKELPYLKTCGYNNLRVIE